MPIPPDREAIARLLRQATRAPSSHNTQPWIFRVTGSTISLFADRTRALPVNDPEDRELTISCGCALANLELAAAGQGLGATVRILPDPDDPDLLAVVELGPGPGAADAADLVAAIPERHTYRKKFRDEPVPGDVVACLVAAAEAQGAWLAVIEGQTRRSALAALVAEGDSTQWSNPAWRRELAAWMHPRHKGDGLAMPGLLAPVAQGIVRSFDMGKGVAARDSDIAAGSPLLAVLGTDGDTPADWIEAGRALERLLLTARARGLQASYLNQPIQVAELRPRLGALIGESRPPQVLLRLGYPAEEIGMAPRRPLEEVVES